MLHKNLELALDRAEIAIVPMPSPTSEENRWKILLIDETKRNQAAVILGSTTFRKVDSSIAQSILLQLIPFQDLDGRELNFRNENSPTRRFHYFRYLMTYMAAHEVGSNGWVKINDAGGYTWYTLGPYLHKSTLGVLAGEVQDHSLPEAFYEKLFTQSKDTPTRSEDDEKGLAMSLGLRVKKERSRSAGEEDEGDEEDEDEDGD